MTLQIKFGCNRPAGLGDIHVWKCGRTHGRTDARTPARVPSYKLTLWAFGSGELKIQNVRTPEKFAVIIVKFRPKWLYHTVIHPKDADGIANSVDPDQTAPLGSRGTVCPDPPVIIPGVIAGMNLVQVCRWASSHPPYKCILEYGRGTMYTYKCINHHGE